MIYQYRALIPESKVFFRVYEVKSEMTLFQFNTFILNDLGFAPDQMVLFRSYDSDGVLCSEYGFFDMGDGAIDTISFAKMMEKGETEFHYVFDLHNQRYLRFVFEKEGELSHRASYPRIVSEKGRNPEQFADKYDDLEEFQEMNEAPEEIVEEGSFDDNE